jgi:predicted membrane channel-forming protein YqfA (hemolysin III family)
LFILNFERTLVRITAHDTIRNMHNETQINIKRYSAVEERLNIGSHAAGFFLSIAALVMLVLRASEHGNAWHIVSFSIFGASLMILYGASTI